MTTNLVRPYSHGVSADTLNNLLAQPCSPSQSFVNPRDTAFRMNRCHLKGSEGDSLHAVLCAAGYNIRWLLRMITKKGLGLFLRLLNAIGFENLKRKLHQILALNLNMRHSLSGVVI